MIISDWIFLLHVSMHEQEQALFTTYKLHTPQLRAFAVRLINISKKLEGALSIPSSETQGQSVSFQAQAKEPLGTDSHRTISKRSSECWLLIGHKKCFVLLCPIGEQHLLSSFREFVHDATAIDSITACLAHAPNKCTQSGNFQFDINTLFQNTGWLSLH